MEQISARNMFVFHSVTNNILAWSYVGWFVVFERPASSASSVPYDEVYSLPS